MNMFIFLDESEEGVDRIVGLAVRTSPNLVICEGIVGFSKRCESSYKDSFEELCEGADKKYGTVG